MVVEELRQPNGAILQLEAKLSISEKAYGRERTLGVAGLKETDDLMRSDDVECEFAKYWDLGYQAFKIQAQAMWPTIDFTLIQPNEIEDTQAEG
ncbi:hypothetical protein U1Q18_005063 [Sarracenia purpurea var. burkii]